MNELEQLHDHVLTAKKALEEAHAASYRVGLTVGVDPAFEGSLTAIRQELGSMVESITQIDEALVNL